MKYQRRHDTVIIFGSHPNTRTLYDWEREGCDVWVFNEAVKTETNSGFAPADRVAGVFQMHLPAIWKNPKNRNDKNHFKWLQENKTIPVFMMEEYPEVPMAIEYPLEAIKAELSDKMLTSSVALAIAYAIHLGYKAIEVYGVEMETNTEYAEQRPGVAYWAGFADGRGVDFKAYWKIFDTLIYGYEGDISLDYQEFTDKIAELEPDCDHLRDLYHEQHKKTSDALTAAVQYGTVKSGKDFSEEFIKLYQMGQEFGNLDGKRQEYVRYKDKADEMIKAGGTFLFSRQEFEQSLVAHGKGFGKAQQESQVEGGKFEALFNAMMKVSSPKNRNKRMRAIVPFMENYVKLGITASMHAGGAEVNRELMFKLDKMIRAAGGEKSEAVLLELAGVTA